MKSYFIGCSTVAPSTSAANYLSLSSSGAGSWNATEAARRNVIPHAVTVDNLRINLTTAPGGVASYAVTLMVNGVASALTCTVTGAATSAQDLSHSVSLVAGDLVSIRVTPSGTPASTAGVYFTIRQTATAAFALAGMQVGFPATAGTQFVPVQGRTFLSVTELASEHIVPTAGTIKNLYFWGRTAPGVGNSQQITLMKNGVATALTCTISAAGTTANDTADTVSVVAGDTVSYQVVTVGTPASDIYAFGATFAPTNDGESWYGFADAAAVNPSVSATNYHGPTENGDAWNTTEPTMTVRMAAATVTAFYASTAGVAPGTSKSYAFTLRQNQTTDTAATSTISNAATSGNATGLSIVVADDDQLSIKSVPTGTPASMSPKFSFLMYITPSTILGKLVAFRQAANRASSY